MIKMNNILEILPPNLMQLIYRLIAVAIIVIVAYFIVRVLERLLLAFLRGVEAEYIHRIVEGVRIGIYIMVAIVVATIIAPEIQILSILMLLIGLSLIAMFFDVLRNIGSEFYIRTKNIVRRGDWIEVDGISIRVVDLDAFGIVGETHKLEKVYIPYTKIAASLIVNRTTPLGLITRIFIGIPQSYSIDNARSTIIEVAKIIEPDLATEPEVTYIGTRNNMLEFTLEFHIINYRKLGKIISVIEKEIKERIPDAVVRT
jgi:small conductance mechanosensitive channel